MSGISGLSFDSPVPISSFVFLPSPLAMFVSVVIFLLMDHSSENSQIFSLGRSWVFFVWLLLSSWEIMVGAMCSLLPCGVGI